MKWWEMRWKIAGEEREEGRKMSWNMAPNHLLMEHVASQLAANV